MYHPYADQLINTFERRQREQQAEQQRTVKHLESQCPNLRIQAYTLLQRTLLRIIGWRGIAGAADAGKTAAL